MRIFFLVVLLVGSGQFCFTQNATFLITRESPVVITTDFFNQLKEYNLFFNYQEYLQTPFYESFEYIIRSFNLISESDSDIQFFLDFAFEYQQKKQPSVDGFLELWELKKDKLSIVAPEAENAVRIMTIHKAKGLEFPYVFVVGLEENLFPSMMSGESQENLEEERRLFYVAITRAKKRLFLSFASTRFKWGQFIDCKPSRFISELDDSFLEKHELTPKKKNDFGPNKIYAKTKFKKNYLKNLILQQIHE